MRVPPRAWILMLAVAGAVVTVATPAQAAPQPPGVPEPPTVATNGLLTWGDPYFGNVHGQLGDGTTTPSTVPVTPLRMATGVKQVSGGWGHTLAVRDDGTAWAWGSNIFGQLGDGWAVDAHVPQVVPGLTNVRQVSAGMYHSLALRTDGTVWAWGMNSNGELGIGLTSAYIPSPVAVAGLTGVVQVSAGRGFSLALRSDGTVWAWGLNYHGNLGDGTTVARLTPVKVSGLTNVIQVAAGEFHGVALRSNGRAWTWGYNFFGALGDGTFTDRSTPVQVLLPASGITQVAANHYATVLLAGGTPYQWGDENDCLDKDPTPPCENVRDTSLPFVVVGLRGVRQISADGYRAGALRNDDTVWEWDTRTKSVFPTDPTPDQVDPAKVSGTHDPVQIDLGHHHTALVVEIPLVAAP